MNRNLELEILKRFSEKYLPTNIPLTVVTINFSDGGVKLALFYKNGIYLPIHWSESFQYFGESRFRLNPIDPNLIGMEINWVIEGNPLQKEQVTQIVDGFFKQSAAVFFMDDKNADIANNYAYSLLQQQANSSSFYDRFYDEMGYTESDWN